MHYDYVAIADSEVPRAVERCRLGFASPEVGRRHSDLFSGCREASMPSGFSRECRLTILQAPGEPNRPIRLPQSLPA